MSGREPQPLARQGRFARRRAVALLSGGLDSAVALGLWIEGGGAVDLCLTADYGQRSAGAERDAAQALARAHGVPWRELQLPFLAQAAEVAGSALVDAERSLPEGTVAQPGDDASAAAVWVPARNVVLVAAGAAWAEALGADAVLLGLNREEAATFPDNSRAFLGACDQALGLGTRSGVCVESPTVAMDKPELGAAARRLGIDPARLWSCYGPGPVPCGVCESCCRFAVAFAR